MEKKYPSITSHSNNNLAFTSHQNHIRFSNENNHISNFSELLLNQSQTTLLISGVLNSQLQAQMLSFLENFFLRSQEENYIRNKFKQPIVKSKSDKFSKNYLDNKNTISSILHYYPQCSSSTIMDIDNKFDKNQLSNPIKNQSKNLKCFITKSPNFKGKFMFKLNFISKLLI